MSKVDSSRHYFSKLSDYLSQQETMYKFNVSSLTATQKYRKGRLSVLAWVNEMSFYFLQEEKKLPIHMKNKLIEKQEELWGLQEGEYRQGVIDAFDSVFEVMDTIAS